MKNWLISMLMNYLVKNWRTSLVGVIGYVTLHFPQVTVWLVVHGYSITDIQNVLILVIALLAKDGSVSNAPSPGPAQTVAISFDESGVRGYSRLHLAIILATALGAMSIAFAARADEPKFGGCVGDLCFAPAVNVNVVAMSLSDGALTSTFDPGIGYGGSAYSSKWYKTGLSITAAFPTYAGGRRLQPAAMLTFAEYMRIGVACPLFVAGGFQQNAQLLLGFGADFGRW